MRKLLLISTCLIAVGVASTLALGGREQGMASGGPQAAAAQLATGRSQTARGPVTPAQIARVQERVARAAAVVDRLAGQAAAEGRSQEWRRTMIESILTGPPQVLDAAIAARSVAELEQASTSAAALDGTAAFGSTTEDLVYKPITPCRYIDTRNVGGAINGTRGFDAFVSGASYGGVAGCALTTLFGVSENDFGALAVNVTVVSPGDAPGFLAVKPTAAAPTTSLLNWYQSGANVQVANAGLVTLDQSSAADEFVIQTSGSAQVIVDIFGAFIAPNATALEIVEKVSAGVTIAAGSTSTQTTPACDAGYSILGGGCSMSNFDGRVVTTRTLANSHFCSFRNEGGGTVEGIAYARCGRVPGR